jgi:hypothetical protein
MTAFELIEDIFRRPQKGVAGNVRRISTAQLVYLRNLIEQEGPDEAIRRGLGGSLTWMPAGRNKYVITDDAVGDKHTLTRMSNLTASPSGSLF